jgi:hypothetical protein
MKTQTFERERIMTADEIRETNYGEVAYLREIAAQIAELNQNIRAKELKAEVNLYESVAERQELA